MASNTITIILSSFAFQFPQLVVWLVGISIARKRCHRHPRISQLTQTALAMALFVSVVSPPLYYFIPSILGGGYGFFGVTYSVIRLINSAAWTAIYIMLLIAIFSERAGFVEPSWHASNPDT